MKKPNKKKTIKKRYIFTNAEARKLAQHRVVKQFIKAIDATKRDDIDNEEPTDWVKHHNLPWKVLDVGGNATVFKNSENKLVIKLNGVFDPNVPHPKRAAPTAVILSKKYTVRVQPVVRTTETAVEEAWIFCVTKRTMKSEKIFIQEMLVNWVTNTS